MSRIFVGLETSFVYDLPATLDQGSIQKDKMNGIAAPLFHPRFTRDDHELSDTRDGPQARSDLVMDSRSWTMSVVGNISKWIDMDAATLDTRLSAEKQSNIRAPMEFDPVMGHRAAIMMETDDEEDGDLSDPWKAWDSLRARCEYHPKLHVALEITADLPSAEEIQRWLGEPVKAAIIATNVFLTNRKGYPALSQRHQTLMAQLFQHKIQFYLSGRPRHRGKILPYVQYLHFLYSKRPSQDRKAQFEAPYLDYLQAPLQPLMDNLESQTYETFEQDAFKYNQYEKAITKALEQTPEDKESVVMVVGPLSRTLSLLGSFGDNELSPECLDGAQDFCRVDGVSIPRVYTSFVTPVMSSKLWNEVKVYDSLKSFETPYVVRLTQLLRVGAHPELLPVHSSKIKLTD
ncbi:unnamed protein product [Peronospora destructor]|uniref:Uncharacterized protein n=1 Tax=Peronospora destructor TaxID=86335 RepID=A0AAV0UXL6_9STRA|nr:unnamed protein product [Peronospora destructor]